MHAIRALLFVCVALTSCGGAAVPETSVAPPSQSPTEEGDDSDREPPAVTSGHSTRGDAMTRAVQAVRGQFQECFEIWAEKAHDERGSIKVQWKLHADGRIAGVDIEKIGTTIGDLDFHDCIVEVAYRVAVPKSPNGRPTVYRYPFNFVSKKPKPVVDQF